MPAVSPSTTVASTNATVEPRPLGKDPAPRWAPFCAVTALLATALAASGVPSPLYAEYERRWAITPLTVTVVYAAYAGGVAVTLLFFGGLSDRIGRRRVLLAGLLGLLASVGVFLLAYDAAFLIAARAIQGLATGLLTGAAGAALADLHPRRDVRAAGLVTSAATSLGIAGGALVSGLVAQELPNPLRTPYLVLFVAVVALTTAVAIAMPRDDQKEPATASAGRQLHCLVRVQRLAVPRAIRVEFLTSCACVVAAWSVAGLYLALGGTIAGQLLHLHGYLVAGLVILLVQGCGGVAALIASSVSERVAAGVGLPLLVLGLASVAWSIHAANATAFIAGDLVSGAGFGLSFLSGTRRVNRIAPLTSKAEVLAAYFLTAYLAISVPVIGVAILSRHLGLARTFEIFAAVVSLVALSALPGSLRRSRP